MKERNYGIDALRMLLMLMVVVLHVLGKGGILESAEYRTPNYYIAWFLEIACYCAVNCYALITGYVYYNKKYQITPAVMLWLQTIFYTVTMFLIDVFFSDIKLSPGVLLDAFTPITRKIYWYVSAYFGLLLIMPLLNIIVNVINRTQTITFVVVSVIFFMLLPSAINSDPYGLSGGYSMIWLAFLYLMGALIRKFGLDARFSSRKCFFVYLASVSISAFGKFLIEFATTYLLGEPKGGYMFATYLSPLIVLAALALFLCFNQLRPCLGLQKLIRFASPAAFGVYLIHCHPFWFERMGDRFASLASVSPVRMLAGILISSVCFYMVCIVIDLIRLWLFEKLQVKELLKKFEAKIRVKYDAFLAK